MGVGQCTSHAGEILNEGRRKSNVFCHRHSSPCSGPATDAFNASFFDLSHFDFSDGQHVAANRFSSRNRCGSR